MITVVIPVGPNSANKRWLDEALDSIDKQTMTPTEVLLIDDMANIQVDGNYFECGTAYGHPGVYCVEDGKFAGCNIWLSPWRLGVAHAFNFGVALARNDLVFLMGSDDVLEPNCLEECYKAWQKNMKADAYYYCGVRYMDDGETQTVPCGYALVTKGFWRKTGGFPLESSSGAPDAAFISICLVHHPESLVGVAGGASLVNYRRHNESDTAGKGAWQGVILETRDLVTKNWKKPEWPRC